MYKPMLALNAHSENRDRKMFMLEFIPRHMSQLWRYCCMEVQLERCAEVDVHQETIVVCVLTTESSG